MSSVGLCPRCGKVISFRFPVHDCRKPKKAKMEKPAKGQTFRR
jgi:hypothetical protein